MRRVNNYKVVEIFSSINGEGPRAGQLAIFIRMQGCNLDCGYCDTTWANQEDCRFHWTSSEEILELIHTMGIHNITITGGEPLIQEGIADLLELLAKEPVLHVEIETNGSVDLEPFTKIENRPSFTMDYKLPGSGMEAHMLPSNFQYLDMRDTVKFVVNDRQDLVRAKEVMDTWHLTEKCHVYLSPVYGAIELEEIVNFMKQNCMNDFTMQLQMHKIIWDPQMRGV